MAVGLEKERRTEQRREETEEEGEARGMRGQLIRDRGRRHMGRAVLVDKDAGRGAV